MSAVVCLAALAVNCSQMNSHGKMGRVHPANKEFIVPLSLFSTVVTIGCIQGMQVAIAEMSKALKSGEAIPKLDTVPKKQIHHTLHHRHKLWV